MPVKGVIVSRLNHPVELVITQVLALIALWLPVMGVEGVDTIFVYLLEVGAFAQILPDAYDALASGSLGNLVAKLVLYLNAGIAFVVPLSLYELGKIGYGNSAVIGDSLLLVVSILTLLVMSLVDWRARRGRGENGEI